MSGRLLPVIPAFRRMEGRIAEGQGKFQASLLNILSVAQSSKSREREHLLILCGALLHQGLNTRLLSAKCRGLF